MAATKKTKTTSTTNPSSKLSLFKDDRIKRILGLILLLISILLFFAFTSNIFDGNADQAITTETIPNDFDGENVVSESNNVLGLFGAYVSEIFMKNMFGVAAYGFCILLFTLGVNLMLDKKIFKLRKITLHTVFLMFLISSFLEFFRYVFIQVGLISADNFTHLGGGIGFWIAGSAGTLVQYFKILGTALLLIAVAAIYAIWTFDLKLEFLKNLVNKKIDEEEFPDLDDKIVPITVDESIFEKDNLDAGIIVNEEDELEEDEEEFDFDSIKLIEEPSVENNAVVLETEDDDLFDIVDTRGKEEVKLEEDDIKLGIEPSAAEKLKARGTTENYDPTLDLSNYKYPLLEFLEEHGSNNVRIDKEELEDNKNQIVQTLLNYKIEISKIRATVGPTVTLYEIIPAAGVRISKIKSLEDDIALSLAALGIRIIAPIPGKGTIGIEVPNLHKEIVSMRSVLASEAFKNSKADLPIGLGKNIANEVVIVDLAKMPHLLMAGATGQGKSVGINAVLISLLYKMHPSQLKFVLVDPKKVELSIYSIIEKHFLAKLPGEEEAIITDVSRVVATLNSLCVEMDDRYNLLKAAKARNLKEYNHKFINRELNPLNGHKFMPFIVLVVDEFADLIMTAGKEVETPIARLAQLARAIGIHLILATQRPSVNIITGLIKANFPARISFKVASKIDSRTILDAGGADQLIGRGDLLISQGSDIIRVQCAFVDTPEVERIVNFIGEQQGYPTAFELPEFVDPNDEGYDNDLITDAKDRDPLFEDAARIIVLNQVGSTSLIQRRLKLGYNRAGRLMDQLEEVGIVGKNAGSKARDVLIPTEADLEQYLMILKENRP